MASYMMCDTGAGPQILVSSPYMGYSPYGFYPPGTPMPQSPFIMSPGKDFAIMKRIEASLPKLNYVRNRIGIEA